MDALERIKRCLADEPDVLFALLFGSRARGTARADSDWDLGIYVRDELEPRDRFALKAGLAAALEPAVPVDIVLLNQAPALLGQRALEGRKLLVRDPRAYVRYFVRTLGAAFDEEYWRRMHSRALDGRLRDGTFGIATRAGVAADRG